MTHTPVIPGNRMRAPLQAQPQPQSTSPGDSYLSGPVTSSVTYPPVIPRYSYPYGNRMRARLLAPQPQSASPGDSFVSGPAITSSVTHPSVIRGYSYPYGNHLRAPLTTAPPFHTTLPWVDVCVLVVTVNQIAIVIFLKTYEHKIKSSVIFL